MPEDWSTDEKVEVGLALGEGAMHGGLAAIVAGVIAAIIVVWRGNRKQRTADAS